MKDDVDDLNLIKHFVNITNTALYQSDQNSSIISEKSVLSALVSGSKVAFCIDEAGCESGEFYTTRFIDGQFTPVNIGSDDPDTVYMLERSKIEEMIEHSDEYIENPLKLDLGWVKASW